MEGIVGRSKKRIRVWYCHKSSGDMSWTSGVEILRDWFDFADWLGETNRTLGAVLISRWEYIT